MTFVKLALKWAVNAVCLLAVFPAALLAGFGRIAEVYRFFSHLYAACPGIPGDYLRIAYYRLTLTSCSLTGRISFGSFFAHPQASMGADVYIGSYCVLGAVDIGDRTQIASGVQILSGSRQHKRLADGGISSSKQGKFEAVAVGADCWIGAGSIVMADIGAGTTIGAGSVITKPIPDGVVAYGNPARVVRSSEANGASEHSASRETDSLE